MSKLSTRRDQLKENTGLANNVFGKLRSELPEVAEALLGRKGQKGAWEVHPSTIMIYADGDQLKWSVNCKDERWTAFGCFPDPLIDLEAMETHLKEGKFELKQRR